VERVWNTRRVHILAPRVQIPQAGRPSACRLHGRSACYIQGVPPKKKTSKPSQPWIKTFTVTHDDDTDIAVCSWDPNGGTVAVAFYSTLTPGMLEQRVWRSQFEPTDEDLQEVVKEFEVYPKNALTSAALRSVPWKAMAQHADAYRTELLSGDLNDFQPPTSEEVEDLIDSGEFAGFRNSRDLRGHAQQLRAVKTYLEAVAVIDELDTSPITALTESEGLSPTQARSLIERARSNGYITRPKEVAGAQIQEAALETARRIREEIDNLSGGSSK